MFDIVRVIGKETKEEIIETVDEFAENIKTKEENELNIDEI